MSPHAGDLPLGVFWHILGPWAHFQGGNEEMFQNVLNGRRKVNGWVLRKIMEAQSEYEGAVAAIKAAPYISTEYTIVSGVKKGAWLGGRIPLQDTGPRNVAGNFAAN